MKVSAKTVNVTGTKVGTSGKATSRSSRRKRAPRTIQSIDSGLMTNENQQIAQLRSAKCNLDKSEEGWYYKYIDPAGSVESHRAVGESSKIPDGLLTFSVDAEIRTISTLSVPNSIEGEVSLSGNTWSLAIFSYPLFRTAYIAVANTLNRNIGEAVAVGLTKELNTLYDYREKITSGEWLPFMTAGDGWYYRVEVLPPTFDAPDPLLGDTRTVTDWRMSYKSITAESNAPSLTDQGLIVGANYALSDTSISEATQLIDSVPTDILVTRSINIGPGSLAIRIPNLLQPSVGTGAGTIAWGTAGTSTAGTLIAGTRFGVNLPLNTLTTNTFTYTLNTNEVWYSSPDEVFANSSDVITFTTTVPSANPIVLTLVNSTGPTTTITIPINQANGSTASHQIFVDLPSSTALGGTAKSIELPAYNTTQIAANNPKMEQFQIHQSGGGYLVHRKIRNPVFELTPAQSYGPIIFTTPGSDQLISNGTGLLDTIDRNFSTGVIVMTGIAWGNSPIIKLYQGWEGLTNVNTTLGQFGHAGLERNEELLYLVDSLSTQTTGFYPAKDNFAAALCKVGAGLLKGLLKSEATQGMMKNIAAAAVNKGLNSAIKRL